MSAVLQGPVDVTFDVWSDFEDYTGGVYKHGSGASYEGLHSVKIVGWGNDSTQGDYWIVQNSWGTGWGPYQGFFLIAKGVNECLIESMVYTGTPDLSSASLN
jgi:C1A family cysteine protease